MILFEPTDIITRCSGRIELVFANLSFSCLPRSHSPSVSLVARSAQICSDLGLDLADILSDILFLTGAAVVLWFPSAPFRWFARLATLWRVLDLADMQLVWVSADSLVFSTNLVFCIKRPIGATASFFYALSSWPRFLCAPMVAARPGTPRLFWRNGMRL